ncbi:MAG TPA: HNH endonuclease, partial [Actinoplanes sp.]|nr:HNH endonuclease [Actinoplanes sp.]
TATTDTGQRLSASTARRLACDARILPAVLGSAGQVLDTGRTQRLATGSLRRALHIRDGGCAFPDCDYPPRWTDAHHIVPWTHGGPTNLDNLVLLCRHHHRLIHQTDTAWHIRLGTDQRPEFIPPAHLDPQQRPRRNLYHQRQ